MVQRVQLDNYVPGSRPEGRQAKVAAALGGCIINRSWEICKHRNGRVINVATVHRVFYFLEVSDDVVGKFFAPSDLFFVIAASRRATFLNQRKRLIPTGAADRQKPSRLVFFCDDRLENRSWEPQGRQMLIPLTSLVALIKQPLVL